jgi:hypothetical protein
MAQNKLVDKRFEVVMLSDDEGTTVSSANPLPVTLGSDTITITGSVNVGTVVQVDSSDEDPVHAHICGIDMDGGAIPVSQSGEWTIKSENTKQGKLWSQQVAEGTVAGTKFVHIAGYNPDIDSPNAPETIGGVGGIYPWSALGNTAHTVYFISTSASDVGCQFLVAGLDGSFNEQTEVITLNGTTAITGTKTWTRINNMTIAGSAINVGTVTARLTSGTGTIIDLVAADEGYNATGIYTIPAGKTGYLMVGDASVSKGDDVTIKMYIREYGKAFRLAHIAEAYESFYRYDFQIPIPLAEKTDIDVRALAYVDNTRVSCNFDIILIDNE